MGLTIEKSQEQAALLKPIVVLMQMLDDEYLEVAARKLHDQAVRQDSLIVLNPSYPMSKTKLLDLESDLLTIILKAKNIHMKILEQKTEVNKSISTQEYIEKLFF